MIIDRQGVKDGLLGLAPMAPPVPITGLVFGLLITDSGVVGNWAGWASSWLVFGGASQLAAVAVLDDGGGALFAILTILVVNTRHVMYSAALQPRYRDAPTWFRRLGPYVLVDQVYALVEPRTEDDSMAYRVSHFLAAGVFWLVLWNISVAAGVIAGNTIGDAVPDDWELEFSVPLLFLGLLVNALRDRPGLLAAAVSGTIAVAARDLQPAGLGLTIGAVAGVAAAAAADHRLERQAQKAGVGS